MSTVMNTHTIAGTVPMVDLNPLHWLGDQAQETLADGFTSMMMAIWSGAMWLLTTSFGLIDGFTPNVADPDLATLYSVTLWIALVIALVMAFGQIGLAVIRQDGRGFGTLAAGVVQYGVVLSCWITVSAGLIAGASGLTKGILDTLLGVDSFSGYAAGDGFVDTVSGTTQAATLGLCALFILIPAAFGHMVIMLVRSAALLILTATMPIAAAGALSEGTKSWMWKSIRWFLACVLIEPLLALVIGMGTQFAWAGMPDNQTGDGSFIRDITSSANNVGLSVVGAVIMLVACFMPLVLFRLLAFVDPGTASGASFRSTMDANGGVAGLVKGQRAGGSGLTSGSGAASETASDGRTTSENGAEAETANRFQSSGLKKFGGGVGGKVGGLVGGAMEKTGKVAQTGAAMSVDVLGQTGVGNQGYYPTDHTPEQKRHGQHREGQHGQKFRPVNDANGAGVANDIPPEAQAAVEDGAFLV
ncbi:type IV secretion system protein [Pimelobacter simplex]|uniref:type IV secretion system protein n=1 Tax=Nocardioides simplex TaxID=2045 RepID=UPI0021504501|nr:type IV secretion system protein [Pimelobacter simplex]UUW92497.1 type IV secretion system protein [Pimelobacter simplex]UUW96325.1 type IV secretion system protein [Pimelobacter simplex]